MEQEVECPLPLRGRVGVGVKEEAVSRRRRLKRVG